jgi:hypothetical protein
LAGNSTDQFAVPDSFLGQSYQIWYALLLLIHAGRQHPDAAVSVETIDDIGIHCNGKVINAVQTKRTVTDLTNASVPLWKTLRIWSEHAKAGTIELEHTVLTLVSTSVAPTGSAASLLRPKKRKEAQALELLQTVVATSKNKDILIALKAFESLTADKRKALIRRVNILDGSPDINGIKTEIMKELRLVAPPGKGQAFAEMLGQRWKGLVEEALLQRSLINYSSLHHAVDDLHGKLQADNLPTDFLTCAPGILPHLNADTRRFVHQLVLIEAPANRVDNARMDHLKASTQRSNWARRELVGIDELPRHDALVRDECRRRHEAMREQLPKPCSKVEQIAAAKAYYDWAEFHAINMPSLMIRPKCVAPYVLRGTFHILADREHDGIGWHPEYDALLAAMPVGRAK